MGEQLGFATNQNLKHGDSNGEHNGLSTTRDLPVGFNKLSIENAHNKFAGLMFMCNRQTMEECFHHGLFGLPYNMWHLVSHVTPGTILFLFEYEERKLRGIYEASSDGKLNIEQSPYSQGFFPSQVRFKQVECCPPLDEAEFRDAIKENYFSDLKFRFDLSYDQVYSLCKAFLWKSAILTKSRVHKSKSISMQRYAPVDVRLSTKDSKHCINAPMGCSITINESQRSGCRYSEPRFSGKWLQNNAAHPMSYLEKSFLESPIINNSQNGSYRNNKSITKRTADRQTVRVSSDRELECSKYECSGLHIGKSNLRPEVEGPQISRSSPFVLAEEMQEETTNIPSRSVCRDGSEMSVYAEKFSQLHANHVRYKPSVWSRISARVVVEDISLEKRHRTYTDYDGSTDETLESECFSMDEPFMYTWIGMRDHSTVVPAMVSEAEDAERHEGNDNGDLCSNDGAEIPRMFEFNYPISFKRRKFAVEVERAQAPTINLHGKRRRIARPDFSSTTDEAKPEREKEESGLSLCTNPDIGEQVDVLKVEEIEVTHVLRP